MAYVALYRKWRPGSFSALVGQEHISRTLSNAITQGKLAHAYLFTGPRGTGKTSTAKILAKALNCEQGPTTEPCNECESCRQINDGTSMDVYEIDAASNRGVDEIRELRETVRFASTGGHYRVYIIDEVHMLTTEAFNALLKTLEEPPEKVLFILATTEAHKIPATIQSRCQRYDFKRLSIEEIAGRLTEVANRSGIAAEEAALRLIAYQADGGMRDALSILDQCAALADGEVTAVSVRETLGLIGHELTVRTIRAIAKGDAPAALDIVTEVLEAGQDLKQLLVELINELRSVMIYQAAGKLGGVTLYENSEELLREQAELLAADEFLPLMKKLNEAILALKTSTDPRITVEAALLSLCAGSYKTAGQAAAPTRVVAAPAADTARLEKLEARVAQLTAALKAAEQRPAPAAPPKPRTARPAAMPPAAPAGESPAPLPVTKDGRDIYDRLMDMIKASGQRSVAACLEGVAFAGFDGVKFRLRPNVPFKVNRISQNDYRGLIEGYLKEITGQELKLECVYDAPAPPKPQAPPRDPADVDPPDTTGWTPEAKAELAKSIAVFGNHFVNKEIYDKDISESDLIRVGEEGE